MWILSESPLQWKTQRGSLMETRPGPSRILPGFLLGPGEPSLPRGGGVLTSQWPPTETAFRLMCNPSLSLTLCAVLGISSAFPLEKIALVSSHRCGMLSQCWRCRHRALGTLFVWTGSFSVSCVSQVKGLLEDWGGPRVPVVWSDLARSGAFTLARKWRANAFSEWGTDEVTEVRQAIFFFDVWFWWMGLAYDIHHCISRTTPLCAAQLTLSNWGRGFISFIASFRIGIISGATRRNPMHSLFDQPYSRTLKS